MWHGAWIVALGAVLLATPVCPQLRGGYVSAGARPGFAAHGPVAARPAVGTRGAINQGRIFTSFPGAGFDWNFRRPFFPGRFHHHRTFFPFNSWWGYGSWGGYYGYPVYGGYAYPLYSDRSSYDAQSSYEQSYQQSYQLQQQVNELSNEVAQLRGEQEAFLARPPAPPPPSSAPAPRVPEKSAPTPPTTLVFRDGRTELVENYGIVGRTLWIFSEKRARRVPLADLDIAATQKANDERGVDFAVPPQK